MSGFEGQAEGPSLHPRAKEIYERWAIWGDTQTEIGKQFGIHQTRVSQIIKEWRNANPQTREDLAESSLAVLRDLRRRQFELAEKIKAGAPVAVGKDGVKLYEDDGTPVRDYSGYLKALAEVRLTDAQIAKRMGLDAPDRLEATQTVRYEIAGVDTQDLT